MLNLKATDDDVDESTLANNHTHTSQLSIRGQCSLKKERDANVIDDFGGAKNKGGGPPFRPPSDSEFIMMTSELKSVRPNKH